MTPQEVQMLAGRCLSALNDNRVMVPSDAIDHLTDLKKILRGLMAGQLTLVDAPKEPAKEPEGGAE